MDHSTTTMEMVHDDSHSWTTTTAMAMHGERGEHGDDATMTTTTDWPAHLSAAQVAIERDLLHVAECTVQRFHAVAGDEHDEHASAYDDDADARDVEQLTHATWWAFGIALAMIVLLAACTLFFRTRVLRRGGSSVFRRRDVLFDSASLVCLSLQAAALLVYLYEHMNTTGLKVWFTLQQLAALAYIAAMLSIAFIWTATLAQLRFYANLKAQQGDVYKPASFARVKRTARTVALVLFVVLAAIALAAIIMFVARLPDSVDLAVHEGHHGGSADSGDDDVVVDHSAHGKRQHDAHTNATGGDDEHDGVHCVYYECAPDGLTVDALPMDCAPCDNVTYRMLVHDVASERSWSLPCADVDPVMQMEEDGEHSGHNAATTTMPMTHDDHSMAMSTTTTTTTTIMTHGGDHDTTTPTMAHGTEHIVHDDAAHAPQAVVVSECVHDHNNSHSNTVMVRMPCTPCSADGVMALNASARFVPCVPAAEPTPAASLTSAQCWDGFLIRQDDVAHAAFMMVYLVRALFSALLAGLFFFFALSLVSAMPSLSTKQRKQLVDVLIAAVVTALCNTASAVLTIYNSATHQHCTSGIPDVLVQTVIGIELPLLVVGSLKARARYALESSRSRKSATHSTGNANTGSRSNKHSGASSNTANSYGSSPRHFAVQTPTSANSLGSDMPASDEPM